MARAQEGNTVRVHYTGRLNDDTVFDSSRNREPLEFIVGSGMVIAGFEEAVLGLEPGESVTVTIPADKAYGPHRDDMIVKVEKEQFPADMDISVGQQFMLPQPDGRRAILTITDVSDTHVTLDANHELAGKDLIFEIELVEII